MKFGLMHDFRNPAPWHRPYGDLYRLLLDQCVRADELGYDQIWLGFREKIGLTLSTKNSSGKNSLRGWNAAWSQRSANSAV